jgi:hypothetical protein
MPSNSLAASPTAPFAKTALPWQILTPLFSNTSTFLPHSFAVRDRSPHVFSISCALFTKIAGVYAGSHFPISIFHIPSSNFFKINTYKIALCKSFRMNTYEKRGGRGGA